MKKWYLIGTTAALILFILADFVSVKSIIFRGSDAHKQFHEFLFKKKVEHSTKKYLQKNTRILKDFEKEISSAGKADFLYADKQVDKVVNRFRNYKTCASLFYKTAKDFVCRTHDTQKAIHDIMDPHILVHCRKGNAKMCDLYKTFCHRLTENNNQYRADIAQIISDRTLLEGNEKAQKEFVKRNMEIYSKAADLAQAKIMTALGVALEVFFFRQTLKALVKVGAHMGKKAAASVASAAVSAAADGPLPIGDVIGVVIGVTGIAWCVYDIHKIRTVLPEEIRTALHKMIRDFERDSRKELIAAARKTVKEFNADSKKIIASL